MFGAKEYTVTITMSQEEARALMDLMHYNQTIPSALKECGEDYDDVADLLDAVSDALREGLAE